MSKLVCLLLLILFADSALAQNLVPNANFALYNSCPSGLGQLDKCQQWYNPSIGTPDYFNACHDTLAGSTHRAGVPDNDHGTQASVSNAYIGVATLNSTANYREYAGIVIPALLPNATYRVILKLSLAEHAFLATKPPGVFFFKNLDTFTSSYFVLSYTPQVDFGNSGHITDKLNWVTVADTFTAGAAYTHMIIGNFSNDASTTRTALPGSGSADYSYYYIDSVAVEKIADPSGVTSTGQDMRAYLSPNPIVDKGVLTIEGSHKTSGYTLSIMNMQGQVVRRIDNIRTGTTVIDCDALATGFYYCRLHGDDGVVWQDKMVVQLQ